MQKMLLRINTTIIRFHTIEIHDKSFFIKFAFFCCCQLNKQIVCTRNMMMVVVTMLSRITIDVIASVKDIFFFGVVLPLLFMW